MSQTTASNFTVKKKLNKIRYLIVLETSYLMVGLVIRNTVFLILSC